MGINFCTRIHLFSWFMAATVILGGCGGGKDTEGATDAFSALHTSGLSDGGAGRGRLRLWCGDSGHPDVVPAGNAGPTAHGGIEVDTSSIPAAQPGTDQVLLTQTQNIPPVHGDPDGFEDGAFRTVCNWTHMSFDDPIVYPGQPGAAHHHTFFGNTAIDAFTTAANIRTKGRASCRGGTVNLSGYWVPSMIDTVSHKPQIPQSLLVYYKTGFQTSFGDHATNLVQPMPTGLRMIAGNPNGTSANPDAQFECYTAGPDGWAASLIEGTSGSTIPTCPAGTLLRMGISFRQCWDGKNLDSPDHQSHLSNFVYWPESPDPRRLSRCPLTHPVVLPRVGFTVAFLVPAGTDTRKWRLASDKYDPTLPGGYSMHADWMNGWEPEIAQLWGVKCMQDRRDCGSFNLGDGRTGNGFQGN